MKLLTEKVPLNILKCVLRKIVLKAPPKALLEHDTGRSGEPQWLTKTTISPIYIFNL